MKNIEKLLDALIKFSGDAIVLEAGKPTYLVLKGIDKPISRKVIGEKDIKLLREECLKFIEEGTPFEYKGKDLLFSSAPNFMRFEVAIEKQEKIEFTQSKFETDSFAQDEEEEEVEQPHNEYTQSDEVDVRALLKLMHKKGASDLHLSSKEHPIMRIDGDMTVIDSLPKINSDMLLQGLSKVTPKRNIDEFKETHDTDFGFEIEGIARFRGNIFRDHRGVGAVFRLIPSTIIPAEKLNIPDAVMDLLKNPKGLILVTGPTGSGKSTTLAAMVDFINKTQKKHIITIEDPVEFVHPNKKSLVNQREISTHTHSFSSALRAALREDPDIVLVGEMRDLETTAIAIEMAATGHLVMGTLHTNTAIGTVDRLIDQFPTTQQEQIKMMLSDALIGVVSQMLCKKNGGGRVAAYEILIVNAAVSNLIREGKNFQIASIMETGLKYGNRLMNRSFKELVAEGTVGINEALSKSTDRKELEKDLIESGLMSYNNEDDDVIKF